MSRTPLDEAWVEAMTFAAIHAIVARNHDRYNMVVDRFRLVCMELDLQPIPANADAVAAAARHLQRALPIGAYALEFHEIGGDGEAVGPSVFETTSAGRAAVWAGRVATAAASGDFERVDDLISVYEATGDADGLAEAMEPFFVGAAMIVNESYPRLEQIDHEIERAAGAPMTYSLHCRGRDYRGQTFPDGHYCLTFPLFATRRDRDQAASEHIADWGHAVKLTEEAA